MNYVDNANFLADARKTLFREENAVRLLKLLVSLSVAGVVIQSFPPLVWAADGKQELFVEEVIVSARKRSERLQDLPGSAAALTEDMIEDIGGVYSLRDITDLIPGITVVEAASSDLMEPSIRGAGGARNRSSVSSVGLYRNGAYFASQGLGGRNFARMDYYDVGQVEVLRGPQGALYGRNSLGGAMNVISKRPDDELGFELGLKAGEKDFQSIEGLVNVPLSDVFKARVSFLSDEREDGFFKNQSGDPVDVRDYQHLRIGLMYDASEAFDIYYSYDVSDDNYIIGIRQRFRDSQTDLRQTLINTPHFGEQDIDNHSMTINYDLGRGVLTSVSNYRMRDLHRQTDGDYALGNEKTATNATRINDTFTDAEVFFQELRFASNLGNAFEYVIGADYYNLETNELSDNFASGGQTTKTSTIRNWEVEQDSWAIFATADYSFEKMPLSVSVEARYAYDDVKGRVVTLRPNQGPDPVLDFGGDNDYKNVPMGIKLAWRFENLADPISEAMAYFSVGSSYRHGGINLGAGLPTDAFPTSAIYDEETSLSYELGLKSAWFDGMLKLNAAAFFVVYADFLETTGNGCPELCPFLDPLTSLSLGFDASGNAITVNPDGLDGLESPKANFIDNVGEVEAWGVEVEASFQIPLGDSGGSLRGNVGWSHQDGEVTDISNNVSPSQADSLGAEISAVRPVQLKSNISWRHPLSISWLENAVFSATANYTHESGGVRSLGSSLSLDNVDRMDARIGINSDHWSFTANGSNVLDKENFSDRTATRFRLVDPQYFYFELSWRY